MKWYPGDNYVDWVGISYFNHFPKTVSRAADVATKLKKPLMLAETSAWYMKNVSHMVQWMNRLFEFINNKNVSALCYINCHWAAELSYASQHFGDARVQSDPAVFKNWMEETSKEKYLKSSSQLFFLLGFVKK